MKKYHAVDIAKFFAAVLVIAIHTNPLSPYSETANLFLTATVARLAVPFFFVSAGFFLARKMDACTHPDEYRLLVKKYLRHILTLYLLWGAAYIPFNIYVWSAQYAYSPFYGFVFIRDVLFYGNYYTLWFMPALLLAVPCACFAYRRLSIKIAVPVCILLYTVGVLGQSYYDLLPVSQTLENLIAVYDAVFLTTRNGLFFGLPFVYMGMYINKAKIELPQKSGLACFGVAMAVLVLETFCLQGLPFSRGNGMWFSLLPAVAFLFLVLLNIELSERRIYLIMRKLSTNLYLSHGLLIIACSLTVSKYITENNSIEFMFILLGTLGFSGLILCLSHKPNKIHRPAKV